MLELMRCIKKTLEENEDMKNLILRKSNSNEAEYTTLPVYLWDLPAKKGKKSYPFILLQGTNGTEDDEERVASIRFFIGVYNEESEDVGQAVGEDIANIIDILFKVINNPGKIADYKMEYPLSYTIGLKDEANFQPLPLGVASIDTNWKRFKLKGRENE